MRILGFLILSALGSMAALAPYSERGKADFDVFLKALAPYGNWTKEGNAWRFHPSKPVVPMTDGQWVYTDWGWYFRGNAPYSFITDHYGHWVCEPQGDWAWQPGPLWHAQKIEWRGTRTHVGWRPSLLNREGEPEERESDRYARAEEWIFIPIEKMKGPITPKDVVTGDEAKKLFETSEPLVHTYTTYRPIDRMGPDPFKVLPPVKEVKVYRLGESVATNVPATNSPVPVPPVEPAEKPAPQDDDEVHPSKPTFTYYTIMSLPTIDATAPRNAKPNEIYVYRPAFWQDTDGIGRRVDLFLHPRTVAATRDKVTALLEGGSIEAMTNAPSAPPSVSPPVAPNVPTPKAVPVANSAPNSPPSAKREGALSK